MPSTILIPHQYSKLQTRIAVSVFYFCQGLGFSSWASRIPDIKSTLHLTEAALGTILLGLPCGQLTTMMFSGRIVTKFGSKNVVRFAIICYGLMLPNIGLVTTPLQLILCLFFFGVFSNLCNVSINTQGINVEALFEKPIMASFHGVWSTAGFTGALIGWLMMKLEVKPFTHFLIVAVFIIIVSSIFNKYLLQSSTGNNSTSNKRITKPESLLIKLGIISFCCLSCEGCMFDWSGVYFKQVVHVKGALISLGYASFMIMMATGRFIGDSLATKFSRKKMVEVSGTLIFSGMMIAVLLPFLPTAILGFLIVGFGVSSIIPLIYSTVGKANLKVSKSIGITTVSSIGFLGFLMGPPLIGYIAQLAGLKFSFTTIAFLGLGISFMISKVKEIT